MTYHPSAQTKRLDAIAAPRALREYDPPPTTRTTDPPRPIVTAASRSATTTSRRRVARSAPAGRGCSLATIKARESGGDYQAVNPNGHYGAYQFDAQTWRSVGGSGNPASASPAEQDQRAAMLYAQRGSQPWTTC